ncbi:MAG: hypothetical protein ACRCZE_01700 [Candidatus Altimarinota bacterium]
MKPAFAYKTSLLFASVLISAFALTGCQFFNGSGNNVYGYDFSTAKITYEISGSSTGSSEALVKGEKKVIKSDINQTKLDGTTAQINSYLIQDGENVYTLSSDTKTGSLIKNPLYNKLKGMSVEDRKKELILEAIRQADNPDDTQNLQPETTETVAGQTCEVYKNDRTTVCLWQGIPLKAVASLPEYGIETTTIATKIELNQDIADSEFAVPSDYQITSLN